MKEIKKASVKVLLDVISKEKFERLLYETVKTADLLKNKLLFDLVDINYREVTYKSRLLIVMEDYFTDEEVVMYYVHKYASMILTENKEKVIFKYYEKLTHHLFDYEKDYELLWDFYEIDNSEDIKSICKEVCNQFDKGLTVKGKLKLLVDGLKR